MVIDRSGPDTAWLTEAERLGLDVVHDSPSLVLLRVPFLAKGGSASLLAG